jgi:hypothetical protein
MFLGGMLIFLSLPAFGAGKSALDAACPSVAELEKHINMCGDNAYAAKAAGTCADAILASWQNTAASLGPLLARDAGGTQLGAEDKARANYEKTLASLDDEIALMKKYTNLVADYILPMFDDPSSQGDDTSLECFNVSFHAVSDIVKNLDKEIRRAMDIRAESKKLLNGSQGNAALLSDLSSGSRRLAARLSGVRAHDILASSRVTGTAESRKLASGKAERVSEESSGKSTGKNSEKNSAGPFAREAGDSRSGNPPSGNPTWNSNLGGSGAGLGLGLDADSAVTASETGSFGVVKSVLSETAGDRAPGSVGARIVTAVAPTVGATEGLAPASGREDVARGSAEGESGSSGVVAGGGNHGKEMTLFALVSRHYRSESLLRSLR